MPKVRTKLKIYTVVEVMRGIAVGSKSFMRIEDAEICCVRLIKQRNLLEDDVQVFSDWIRLPTHRGFRNIRAMRKRAGRCA